MPSRKFVVVVYVKASKVSDALEFLLAERGTYCANVLSLTSKTSIATLISSRPAKAMLADLDMAFEENLVEAYAEHVC